MQPPNTNAQSQSADPQGRRSSRRSRGGHLLAVAVLTLSVVAVFRNAIVTDEVFAFRDAAHFYYPLFHWTTEQWKAGEIPLWNPLEDLGAPVVADATSSVFYPVKAIFLIPNTFGTEYGTWYKAYIILHVWLCGITSYILGRHWRRSASSATLAGISYALGGNVFFQYCNVVYLVGAAWLPLAIRSGDKLLNSPTLRDQRTLRHMISLAICLAMMVLGGDAQMAYHTGMMLAGLAWLKRRASARRFASAHLVLRLLLAACVSFGLAAVQSIPSANWLRQSTRASYDTPRNVYEYFLGHSGDSTVASSEQAGFSQTLLGKTESGHHSNVYDFSVGPWRLIELIWPNVGGKMFPENQRWMEAIPAEGRVWTPSLYMGFLPILFASLSFRLRRGTVWRRFLSWCGLLAIVGAFGSYGVGWVINELNYAVGGDELGIGNPLGGLYWFCTVTLPGYVYFRYPAKLWVIAAFAISQLAGQAIEHRDVSHDAVRRRLKWIIAGTLCLVAAQLIPIHSIRAIAQAPISIPFGPLDVDAIKPQLAITAVHTLVLATTILALANLRRGKVLAWTFVVLSAGDLCIANRWLLPTAPLPRPSYSHGTLPNPASPAPRRLFSWERPIDLPDYRTRSHRRFHEILRSDSESLYPKYHLMTDLGVVGSRHSLDSAYLSNLFVALTGKSNPKTLSRRQRRSLGIFSRRVRIVRNVKWQKAPDPRDRNAIARYFESFVRQRGPDDDNGYEHHAIIDAAAVPETPAPLLGQSPNFDRIVITGYENQRVELQAGLASPGLVVLNDTYTDGWKAYVTAATGNASVRVPVFRTNGAVRGVYLPAGRFTIEMRYEPGDFYRGAWISGMTWSLCLLCLIMNLGYVVRSFFVDRKKRG